MDDAADEVLERALGRLVDGQQTVDADEGEQLPCRRRRRWC
ncbi:MAG TPA: hypothetical protein VIU86_05470 [Gaiellaceae bacterium]